MKNTELESKVGRQVIHRAKTPRYYTGRGWTHDIEDRDVLLMALVGRWAMVRRPRAVPYVAPISELL